MNLFQRLYRMKDWGKNAPGQDVEALRIEFKARYHAFRRLLAANQKALEIMADMELHLASGRPFGMTYVRRSVTGACVSVLKMIDHLDLLAAGKYSGLKARFEHIRNAVEDLMVAARPSVHAPLVVDFPSTVHHAAAVVGNKMANLMEIKHKLDVRAPDGFVITAAAYEAFIRANDLQAEIDRRCQAVAATRMDGLHALSSGLQQLIIRAEVPAALREEIERAVTRLERRKGKMATLALRSSAVGEDSPQHSFAGQYRSLLNVAAASLPDAYKEVLAGKYTLQAMAYRLDRGFRDEDVPMSVGCLEMVNAVAGGVAYSRNPVNADDDTVSINAVWGLPKSVVDGSDEHDSVVVSRNPLSVVSMRAGRKTHRLVCLPEEGLHRAELPGDLAERVAITTQQALELAALVLDIEAHYRCPQDVEWALTPEGSFTILQCRPLQVSGTTAASLPMEILRNDVIFENSGVTAGSGAAVGTVFQVHKNVDMLGFPKGAVLVTRQALPAWAPLLDRVAAVVTETGGFAGHLANVAREFGVPALFGVKGALQRLQNGRVVTVDADRRIVYAGTAPAALDRSARQPRQIIKTPVYDTLQKVSRLIVPLHLLDPHAPGFTPANCKSLHDITRFVHEKSVHAMFDFGRSHDFSERSGKQLYYNVPMQWWILNLDDGFIHEVSGRYVRLENIGSIPMLAFWDGYTAVPWDGPPPVDGKGLVAVMFQSTINPSLATGMRSRYAERNYFMISKNFCSLSSRLGFHFSSMEALVGDRLTENYVSFQFKGGAADQDRRTRRVTFVGDILEAYGFRVEIRGDHLTARVENDTRDFMSARIRILGYLALHTRQLDMIMANNATVAHYSDKIRRDLETIVEG